uniref:ABC-F family ATP-binding cassette domain-containing protein n=1 Tax=Desulfatirhabdium butyrativorans TaxID=340467 RepID=A0A7C4RPL6_9BACT
MITVDNLSKSYGDRILFDEASFKVNPKERIGLVGRNGHGKTTLFRILTGKERPDSGTVLIPKLYRIAHVEQEFAFTEPTVLLEGMKHLPANQREHHWKVERILAGLGFSNADMKRNPLEFSGGFQVRLNLAKILVSDPDMLLLDEPTNYLDIASIRWIQRFLASWPRELMLITHDRGFMDAVITHTLGIHRRKIRKIAGTTEKYYAQLAQDEAVYEKTRINDEKKRKEIELFISRFRAKARLANMVQSRIKTLSRMTQKDKLEKIRQLEFSFNTTPFPGKQMVRMEKVSFSYDPTMPLIREVSCTIESGRKIGVIGRNGKGKTTLLRLLAGSLSPRSGKITVNPGVAMGVYEQTNIQTLVAQRTVEEEIWSANPRIERQAVRNICGAMLFEGDDALKKIDVLSGGEKSRVMLGKILLTPCNLLLLDEPTNHLDMDACDALLEALDSFDGTLVMVTHNETFLHALADSLIVFQDNAITHFDGTYQRFLETVGWTEEVRQTGGGGTLGTNGEQVAAKTSRKELRKIRSELVAAKSRDLKPLETAIAEIEGRIMADEQAMSALGMAIQSAAESGDGIRIASLSRELAACQERMEADFERLDVLTRQYDEKKAYYDNQLNEAA